MKWLLAFYNERRRILAHYAIEAPLPATAVSAGWDAVRAEHPERPTYRALGLLGRAERASSHDRNGWVLYRIGTEGGPPVAAPAAAAVQS